MYKKVALAVITCLMTGYCFATPWDGVTLTPVTPNGNVYTISEAAELAWLANESKTNDFAGKTIELTADLDVNKGFNGSLQTSWTPIGSYTLPFQGTFDGKGHVVRNLYFAGPVLAPIGLFGKVGTEGVVKNVAVTMGEMILGSIDDVGGIIGVNDGTLSHCFNMMGVFSKGNNVGGLVGTNNGTIEYCYNTGIVENGNTMGGIAGSNTGTIKNSYNIGHCVGGSQNGAIYGKNTGSIINCYYDGQMCRRGSDYNQPGVNTIPESTKMSSIFQNDDEWVTSSNYPALAVFGSHNALLASICIAELDFQKGNAADKVEDDFTLREPNGCAWTLPHFDDIIKKKNGTKYTLELPCGTHREDAECWKGEDCKYVYLSIIGYTDFAVGVAGNTTEPLFVCKGSKQTFVDNIAAKFGKDDEMAEDKYPYYYKIEKYSPNTVYADGTVDTTFANLTLISETEIVSEEKFKKTELRTDSAGVFVYRRWTHDSKCQTNYQLAEGYFIMQVGDNTDAGEIDTTTVVLYGDLPMTTTINNVVEASGGKGPYTYRWRESHYIVDYNTGASTTVYSNSVLRDSLDTDIDTTAITVTFTEEGEYIYSREAHDKFCFDGKSWANAPTNIFTPKFRKRIIVLRTMTTGIIHSGAYTYCNPEEVDLVIEEDSVCTGGNGVYEYQWLCNGAVIADANGPTFNVADYNLAYGQNYVFTRKAKDGYKDGFEASEGSVTVTIRRAHNPGSIKTEDKGKVCLDRGESINLNVTETAAPVGEGTISYKYTLNYLRGNDTVFIADIAENSRSLSGWTLDPAAYNVNLPQTFVIKRVVMDEECMKAGEKSGGAVTITIGSVGYSSHNVNICKSELPYMGSRTLVDGSIKNFTFNADGEQVTISDQTADGCPKYVTYTCHVKPQPTVEVERIGALCVKSTTEFITLTINYTITSGKVTDYYLTFSDALKALGGIFAEENHGTVDGTSGSFEFQIPNSKDKPVPEGDHSIYIRYEDKGEDGCLSDENVVSFSISQGGLIYQVFNDIIAVNNYGNTYVHYQWYKDGEPIEGATDQYYYEPNGDIEGYYSVAITNEAGITIKTCDEKFPQPQTGLVNANGMEISVYPNPAGQADEVSLRSSVSGRVQIIGLDGRQVSEQRVSVGENILHTPSVAGMYMLRIISENNEYTTQKLIVK